MLPKVETEKRRPAVRPRPVRTTPMSAPQTKSELPKNGASTRLAAISTPSSTAPQAKTAALIAAARTRSTASIAGKTTSRDPAPRREEGRQVPADDDAPG